MAVDDSLSVLRGSGVAVSPAPPTAPMWVGRVDTGGPVEPLAVDAAFTAARLLVTTAGVPIGLVDVPLSEGRAGADRVSAAIVGALGGDVVPADPLPAGVEPITVVVATRGRPDSLVRCVRSVLRSDHPEVRVLVVDNDPVDELTADAVAQIADARVEYVRESRRGASVGRNRGLAEAAARTGGFVAFVDDDVEVDPAWLGRMAAALSQPGVMCVCGPVFGAELDTQAQVVADDALGWRKGYTRRRFSLDDPPADTPLFPFTPGLFGVGANMAVNAAAALELGGFDPALGPGTATRGGEDCEFMIRLILAGHALSYEPSAFVWHHHRTTREELDDQLHGYALGLGGFLAKIMLDPVGRAEAVSRLPAAVRRLWAIRAQEKTAGAPGSAGLRTFRTLVSGPHACLQARRSVHRAGGSVPGLTTPPRPPKR